MADELKPEYTYTGQQMSEVMLYLKDLFEAFKGNDMMAASESAVMAAEILYEAYPELYQLSQRGNNE